MSAATPPAAPERRRRPLDRLRTRVAASAAGAALVALLVVGLSVLRSATAADRDDLDAGLVTRVEQAAAVGRRTLRAGAPRPAVRATRRVGRIVGPVTGGADVALVRIVRRGAVVERLGATADPGLPPDAPRSPATVDTPDGRWRIVQRPVGRGLVVQAASPLATLDARRAGLRDRLLVAGAAGVLGTGLLAFVLAGPALGALTRLRRDAAGVAETADLDVRLPEEDGPAEVRELGGTLNAMLVRLAAADAERRAALATSQRFAADAGHELRTPLTALTTTVEALRAHPDLPPDERATMLDEIAEEHARLVALVDALQALARGDAGARLEGRPVDLVETAEQALAAARVAAPRTRLRLDAPDRAVVVGWAPGLRLVLDNLVQNAVRHGRDGGDVVVSVEGGPAREAEADGRRSAGVGAGRDAAPGPPAAVVVTVDDDGPGIPADERAAVLARFARGRDASAPGSGLGLALVEQQVRLHGGTLELGDASGGGLRVRVVLPAA